MINKLASAALRAGIGERLQQSGTPSETFPFLDKAVKGIDFIGRQGINTAMLPGRSPATAALVGLGVGGAYDIYKRLTNTTQENDDESALQRISRYAIPAGALGLMGSFTNSAFSNYYNHYPQYKA